MDINFNITIESGRTISMLADSFSCGEAAEKMVYFLWQIILPRRGIFHAEEPRRNLYPDKSFIPRVCEDWLCRQYGETTGAT